MFTSVYGDAWTKFSVFLREGGHRILSSPGFCLSPEKYRDVDLLGDDFRNCFHLQYLFSSTADTCSYVSLQVNLKGARMKRGPQWIVFEHLND